MTTIKVSSDERVLMAGKTGSGKSYLMKHLTRRLTRLVVLDGKSSPAIAEWGLEEWGPDTKRRLLSGEAVRVRVRPELTDDLPGFWDRVMADCYNARNVVVCIDELYAVAEPGRKPPPMLSALYTRGRELGIGVWAATQRPTWLPIFALSEADHFFAFRLTFEADRRRMAGMMAEEVIEPIDDKHGFYYMAADGDNPIYVPQLVTGAGVTLKAKPAPVEKR